MLSDAISALFWTIYDLFETFCFITFTVIFHIFLQIKCNNFGNLQNDLYNYCNHFRPMCFVDRNDAKFAEFCLKVNLI